MEAKQTQAKLPESEEEQHERLVKLLEEHLEKHDNNRKAVQGKLAEILNKLREQVDELEDGISRGLKEKFTSEEDRLQAAINELRGNNTISALQKVKVEFSVIQSYEIIQNNFASKHDLTTLYELKTERRTINEDDFVGLASSGANNFIHGLPNATEMSETPCDPKFSEVRERFIELLEERLEKHDENRKAAQDKLTEICKGLKAQIGELEDRTSKELEEKFTFEDKRLQASLNELRGDSTASALQKAKAELLVEQLYELIEIKEVKLDLTTLYELKAERRIVPGLIKMRKPTNVRVTSMNRGIVSVHFIFFNPDEERVLSGRTIVNPVKYKCLLFKKINEQESKEYPLVKNGGNNSSFFLFAPDTLEAETTYGVRVKIVIGGMEGAWGDDVAEFTTPEFRECCVWKKCSDDVGWINKYSVDERNPIIATKANNCGYYCTIIGNTLIPPKTVTSWSIKVLKSKYNDGGDIFIGVAPYDIDQNDANYNKCGWYFSCYYSKLYSGPPHKYNGKEHGPRKGRNGQYVHTGDSVGVVVDTTKGDFSFVLNGVNLGAAYEGIPLDKPLVPCVILDWGGGSIELDTSEVKENVDISILVPSNITAKSITWDTITLTWDEVEDVSFYQIEVDGSISCCAATKNSFTKRGLLPETEHSFRVRTMRGNSVGEWSGDVKGRTLKAPEFLECCAWKECPDDVDSNRKYSVDEKNPGIATKVNSSSYCTIIGNTYIPLNAVTLWSVNILKSWDNNGYFIFIGIAPSDINQNEDDYNYNKCGWYFSCWSSTLSSGLPHNYRDKEYGPRKEKGQYVHTGDSVGVVVDTTKGELSFVLNGANLGIAYEGIPLDKPLVPCVFLYWQGDSVELII